ADGIRRAAWGAGNENGTFWISTLAPVQFPVANERKGAAAACPLADQAVQPVDAPLPDIAANVSLAPCPPVLAALEGGADDLLDVLGGGVGGDVQIDGGRMIHFLPRQPHRTPYRHRQ